MNLDYQTGTGTLLGFSSFADETLKPKTNLEHGISVGTKK